MLHGVYPFNGTDEIRRTMSYNCDLFTEHQKRVNELASEKEFIFSSEKEILQWK